MREVCEACLFNHHKHKPTTQQYCFKEGSFHDLEKVIMTMAAELRKKPIWMKKTCSRIIQRIEEASGEGESLEYKLGGRRYIENGEVNLDFEIVKNTIRLSLTVIMVKRKKK